MIVRSVGPGGAPGIRYLLSLAFPTTGILSATTNLGIAWADPSDHTVQLDATKFPFPGAVVATFNYISVSPISIWTTNFLKVDPNVNLEFFVVDAAGADIHTLSSSTTIHQSSFSKYNIQSFKGVNGATVGNGIRGQLTITGAGTYSINIPAAWLFYGGPA